ncbi:hypothetical protein Mgra_00004533 [Meloidogyne graminicola]|uniref:Uncharacterized protein n=1 Tax=Meloidogyne graminicola TaxID=189291 RepID=A0A8S9ZSH3_9BILA|nr:hypothetical protein Mgra_00004533 [Meloidogyne graminicola]
MFYFLFIYLLLNSTFYNEIKGLDPNIVKELAEYLVLYKNVQTEIFAERINGHDNLKIFYDEIREFMGNENARYLFKEAKNCFEKIKLYKLKKFFHMKTDNLLIKIQQNNITFHDEERNYGFNIKKLDKIIGYEVPELINEETAIDNYFKINYNGNYYVYRLKKFELPNTRYYENTLEYEELFKCKQVIWEAIPQFAADENDRKFIDLNKLYKRFNPNQLYFNYIPIFEGDQILQKDVLFVKRNLCLENILIRPLASIHSTLIGKR